MQDHSDTFKVMVANLERFRRVDVPDGYGIKKGDCGDIVEIYLRIDADVVKEVSFQVAGCLNTFACANAVSYLAEGKEVGDCWQISPELIVAVLESLPDDHHHCAELAVGTFYLALNNYNRKQSVPS
ncbi:iron-sulfur cluster assembly scaffold protein [Desulfopila sp. IMCC35008]|uniref:iron-sulfur cluster assembly scaffold protein n=1 Tax=Desulfopila sp. IMCC35008 TaxID=2653858 RepID=UPI0013D0C4F8|nr:iron-sulfur cluster assembly scaffold protein [Desulfopila sp. IMCC35008]